MGYLKQKRGEHMIDENELFERHAGYEDFFVILRNGVYWTDYLYPEEACEECIIDSMKEYKDSRDCYNYRNMTRDDILQYYSK